MAIPLSLTVAECDGARVLLALAFPTLLVSVTVIVLVSSCGGLTVTDGDGDGGRLCVVVPLPCTLGVLEGEGREDCVPDPEMPGVLDSDRGQEYEGAKVLLDLPDAVADTVPFGDSKTAATV